MKSKKNGEVILHISNIFCLQIAHLYVMGIIEECTKKDENKFDIDSQLEEAFKNIIYSTTIELLGEPNGLEKKMKKSIY